MLRSGEVGRRQTSYCREKVWNKLEQKLHLGQDTYRKAQLSASISFIAERNPALFNKWLFLEIIMPLSRRAMSVGHVSRKTKIY